MKWVEIITLRSPTRINAQFVDELLKQVDESDIRKHLVGIRTFQHAIVETDLSIHIYWESESGSQQKSPLGLKFSYALKDMGLLNHSVWVETATLESVSPGYRGSSPPAIRESDGQDNTLHAKPEIVDKEGI